MKLSSCDVTWRKIFWRVGQGVQPAWLSLGSALETPWLVLGRPHLSSYAQMGWENSPLTLHGTHFHQGSISSGKHFPSLDKQLLAKSCEVGGWKPDVTGLMRV